MSGPLRPAPTAVGSWDGVEALAEPTRRAVFAAVRAARRPVTRDEVAAEVGLQRTLAAFHLDRLAEAGLVEVSYARPPGRTGRGAGRPAKRYDASDVTVAFSLPGRQHELVGQLLARAVAEQPRRADHRAAELAEAEGERLAGLARNDQAGEKRTSRPGSRPRRMNPDATLVAADAVLRELGYEPHQEGSSLRLRNCPFHGVMEAAPQLVCTMNHRLVSGLLAGLGGSSQVTASLHPSPGECCVVVEKRSPRSSKS